jgi:hypothetical protein
MLSNSLEHPELIEFRGDRQNVLADKAGRKAFLSAGIVSVEDERLVGFDVVTVDLAQGHNLIWIKAGSGILSRPTSYRFRPEAGYVYSAIEGKSSETLPA